MEERETEGGRDRETKRKHWEKDIKRDGEKISSRLSSHMRLFSLFKAHREVIGGKDGKIPHHLFLHCHSYLSGPDVHILFQPCVMLQPAQIIFSMFCAQKALQIPPWHQHTDGVVTLYDYILCMHCVCIHSCVVAS